MATKRVQSAELIWRPEARQDLLDIYMLVGLDNPQAAERLYDLIEARASQLSDHPRLGPRRPDIRPAARMLVVDSYLILFETVPDTDDGPVDHVEIIRVLDGRRNLARLL
ncbi:MAG: type II toxin-antitoxin system RelE/ParE family toxin [Aliidongia sp.]